MKLDQIEQIEENGQERRIRYRVTLTTQAGNATVFWQMNINGNSPGDAVMTAHQLFRKGRGDIQSAVMSQWEVREVTPLKTV
jgi:hypothetical protein